MEKTYKNVLNLLRAGRGKFFHVSFVKRTTGEVREITARLNVKSHLKGGELPYDAKTNNLITVFDVNAPTKNGGKGDYRSIPVENIISMKVSGVTYEFKPRG